MLLYFLFWLRASKYPKTNTSAWISAVRRGDRVVNEKDMGEDESGDGKS